MAPALDGQFSIDEEDRKTSRDPEPEIVILAHREGLVEEPNFWK